MLMYSAKEARRGSRPSKIRAIAAANLAGNVKPAVRDYFMKQHRLQVSCENMYRDVCEDYNEYVYCE